MYKNGYLLDLRQGGMQNYSLTLIGVLVAVLGPILVEWGFTTDCSNEIIEKIPLLIGGVMAWYGRVRAGGVSWTGRRV